MSEARTAMSRDEAIAEIRRIAGVLTNWPAHVGHSRRLVDALAVLAAPPTITPAPAEEPWDGRVGPSHDEMYPPATVQPMSEERKAAFLASLTPEVIARFKAETQAASVNPDVPWPVPLPVPPSAKSPSAPMSLAEAVVRAHGEHEPMRTIWGDVLGDGFSRPLADCESIPGGKGLDGKLCRGCTDPESCRSYLAHDARQDALPAAPAISPDAILAIHAAANSLVLQLAGLLGAAETLRDLAADMVMGADLDGSRPDGDGRALSADADDN